MGHLFPNLKDAQQRGSKPRCHLLTEGSSTQVASRLTNLIAPWGEVRSSDQWMPQGFTDVEEAQLGKATRLLEAAHCETIQSWWLAKPGYANTPNWDIASTCLVNGQEGLLLIEAKAHDNELIKEERGKPQTKDASANSILNHDRIGSAISEASTVLTGETGLSWALSVETHYQMANRFASAWKLTQMGVPVILVYLGFLDAVEMSDQGQPFASDEQWQILVKAHSRDLFPEQVWNASWAIHEQALVPLIRTVACPLPALLPS